MKLIIAKKQLQEKVLKNTEEKLLIICLNVLLRKLQMSVYNCKSYKTIQYLYKNDEQLTSIRLFKWSWLYRQLMTNLFDQGYITFTDNGELSLRNSINVLILGRRLRINPNAKNKMRIFQKNEKCI